MPEELESCVEQVMAQGHDESSAYAICNASLSDKSFEDTELAQTLKASGADEDWVDTVGRLVRSDVEPTVVANVVAQTGSRTQARKAMAKSSKIEKVGFEAEVKSQFSIFKAGDDDFVVWGPASVEVVDKEGDKIQAKALQKALPQLLKRARLSLEHSDQLVGRILERFETDEEVTVEIGERKFTQKEFPTDVLELDGMESALYVAGEIYNDSRQARDTRKRIENGELNSYSISGEALVTQKRITSEGDTYDDIVDLDLSAVTVCEEGMNQEAKFARIQEQGDKTASATAKSDDPVSPANGQGEFPTVSAVASIAKNALDSNMSEDTKSSDNSGGEFDPEALTAEFKSVLDSALPDGELATKNDLPGEGDILTREDVEQIVDERMKEDDAGEEDQQDEGTSEAEARPGEEADVDGSEAKGEDPEDSEEDEEMDYDKAVSALAENLGVDKDAADAALRALKGDGQDPDEIEDPDDDGEEELDIDPTEDEDEPVVPEEEKGDEEVPPEEEEEVPVPEEEEEEAPPEEEEPPAPDEEMKEGYSEEDLEEMLPSDVYEVVREYLDDGGAMGAEDEEAPEDVMEASKSEDIEAAVEKILSGAGLASGEQAEKAEGAQAPSGNVEKSYDDSPEGGSEQHGGNPALSTFYGE